MNNILLLTDFTSTGQKAVEFGYHLAAQLHANIILCNVMNIQAEIPQFEVPVLPFSDYDYIVEKSEKDLFQLKAHLDKLSASQSFQPKITCLEEIGRVTDTVSHIVANHQAELVILGEHQRKGLSEWVLSNHAKELIEIAKIPIIIIPLGAKIKRIEKVALALKHPEKKENELNQVYKLVERLSAELFIFRVEENNAENEMAEKARINTMLKELKKKLKVYLRTAPNGPVEKQLKSLSKSEKIDLLIMIHQKRSFFSDMFIRSHSRNMSVDTTIPLMIIPSHPNAT
ncbi:MAG TPA: universal stress protein [Pelobium sp.]|nr:universal stress protein [Pelobium sp.]